MGIKRWLLLILGGVTLVVSFISFCILMDALDVTPGYYNYGVDSQTVNTSKTLIWCFGLLGGGLIGLATALRSRSRIGPGVASSRKLILLIPGILLILWSIERLIFGIAPDYGLYGRFYDFSAAVAAIILIIIVPFGGFLMVRGLIPMPRREKG